MPIFVRLFDLADFFEASDRPTAPPPSTTSSPSTLEAHLMDDAIVFNMVVNGAGILLKPLMKRR